MKIGIITDETDTQLVGFGTYTLALTRHILQQDKKNEYYLIHRRKEAHDIYRMGAKEIIVPAGRFPLSAIRNFITLPLILRKHRLDVVHHMTGTGPFVFKPLMCGKSVETIHEILPLLHPKSFEPAVRWVYRLLLPQIAKNVDAIITPYQGPKDDIVRKLRVSPKKIHVIPPGAASTFRPLNKAKSRETLRRKYGIRDRFMLFVSTLEAKKNVPTLLRAHHLLKKRGYKENLVLVGRKGYGYEQIAATIQQLGLEKEIIMPGYVPREDLPLFYNAAELFVFPAFDASAMTVVDAMRCGCPLVVSNGGGSRDAFGNAPIMVDVMDAAGYAAAMGNVLHNKKLAAAMRKKSLARAKTFSWEESAKKTIALYEELCT